MIGRKRRKRSWKDETGATGGLTRQAWLRDPNEISRVRISILAAPAHGSSGCCSWVAVLPHRDGWCPLHHDRVLVAARKAMQPYQAVSTHPSIISSWHTENWSAALGCCLPCVVPWDGSAAVLITLQRHAPREESLLASSVGQLFRLLACVLWILHGAWFRIVGNKSSYCVELQVYCNCEIVTVVQGGNSIKETNQTPLPRSVFCTVINSINSYFCLVFLY